jgi:DNA-directed RNA polymerase specialized sigma24 family protein
MRPRAQAGPTVASDETLAADRKKARMVAWWSDEQLLAGRDGASFECFYRRHVRGVLAYFVRRTQDPAVAAELTAETFATALAGRRRYGPRQGRPRAWLFVIADRELRDVGRTGHASRHARRRVGMPPLPLDDGDLLDIGQRMEEAPSALEGAPSARAPSLWSRS